MHYELNLPETGVEPVYPKGCQILSLVRLPFRHSGMLSNVYPLSTKTSAISQKPFITPFYTLRYFQHDALFKPQSICRLARYSAIRHLLSTQNNHHQGRYLRGIYEFCGYFVENKRFIPSSFKLSCGFLHNEISLETRFRQSLERT